MKKILIILVLFFAFKSTFSQTLPPSPYTSMTANWYKYNNYITWEKLSIMGLIDTIGKPYRAGGFGAWIQSGDTAKLMFYDGVKWKEVTGGGGGGSGGDSTCPVQFSAIEGFLEENVNAKASLDGKQDTIPYGNTPVTDEDIKVWDGWHQWSRLDTLTNRVFGITQSTLGGNPYYTWQPNSNMLLSRGNITNLDSISYIGGQFFYGGGTLGTKPTSNSNGIVLSFGQNVNNLINNVNQSYQISIDGNGALSGRVAPSGTGVWGAWVRPIYSVDLSHYLYDTGATVLGRLNTLTLRVGDTIKPTVATLDVVNTTSAASRGVGLFQYNTGNQGAQFSGFKARGTVASPTVITTGDGLLNIFANGYDGANWIQAAQIRFNSVGTIATNIIPTTIDFRTATALGVLTTALNLDQTQKATFTSDVSIGGNMLVSGSVNKVTITPPTTSSTLRIRDGKTLDVVNSVGFSGTDGSTLAFRTGGTVIYSTDVMTSTVGGLTPTPPNDATKFLSGAGTYINALTSANVGNGLRIDSNKVKWGGTMYENVILDANQKNVTIANMGSGTFQSTDGTNASSLITNIGYAGISNYDVNNLTTLTVGNTDVGGVNGAQISASNITGTKNMVMTLFDSMLAIKYVVSSSPTNIFKMSSAGVITLATWQGTAIADAYISSSTNWNSAYTDRLKWDGGSTGLTASTGRSSLGATTVGSNIFTSTNPSAVRFLRANADNSVDWLDAATFLTAIGGGSGGGSVSSVAMTVPPFLSVSGSPITTSGTLAVSLSGTALPLANGGTGATGSTTINGTGITYGTTNTITAAAGTLTGTTLNSTVVSSSLTSHGTITSGGLGTGAVIGGVTMTLGSDATNDMYYRDGSGILHRLANGSTGQLLTATTGSAPSWVAPATSGTVTTVGFTGGLISVANPTTAPAFTVAGTSGGIPYFSSTSTWASSGLLSANAILIGGGSGAAPSSTTTGTGVLTALGVNTGSAGSFVVNGGALGTPASGVGTNLTGTASGLTAGSATALATPRTIGTVTGDATSAGSSFDGTGNNTNSITVTKVNGTAFSGLATGILKNTTSTGVPSIAVAADFPTLNQNTTGSAASLTTPRTITATSDIAWTITFDGTANATAAATIANSAITTAKMANWSSHTHWVNNGGSAAAPVETPYYQAKNVTYDGTATWDGTTPTTATITYDLIRDGIWVTLIIHGDYTGAGATNTQLTLTLPSAAPTPTGPTGRTSANNRQYAGFGGFSTAKTANWATNNKVWVQLNGSSVPIIVVVGNST